MGKCTYVINYPYEKPIKLDKIGTRRFQLQEDTELFGTVIPSGYESDGASVPRPLWWILSPFSEGFRAALVHDYRYTSCYETWTKKQADREFLENLGKDGVNIIRRTLAYLAVKMFGRGKW